jgi:hypothetical protein
MFDPCADSRKDDDETDVDCGGDRCNPCPVGARCEGNADCESQRCSAGRCVEEPCSDERLTGSETDVDCGGDTACSRCGAGAHCLVYTDCASHYCIAERCEPASCDNDVKDATETGVDCGGAVCNACADGESCLIDDDCLVGACWDGKCPAGHCLDERRDKDETDVDCGGSSDCARCANGKICWADRDCASGSCSGGFCSASQLCNYDTARAGENTKKVRLVYLTLAATAPLANYTLAFERAARNLQLFFAGELTGKTFSLASPAISYRQVSSSNAEWFSRLRGGAPDSRDFFLNAVDAAAPLGAAIGDPNNVWLIAVQAERPCDQVLDASPSAVVLATEQLRELADMAPSGACAEGTASPPRPCRAVGNVAARFAEAVGAPSFDLATYPSPLPTPLLAVFDQSPFFRTEKLPESGCACDDVQL